jgi:hypothetical protein
VRQPFIRVTTLSAFSRTSGFRCSIFSSSKFSQDSREQNEPEGALVGSVPECDWIGGSEQRVRIRNDDQFVRCPSRDRQ